MKKGTLSMLLAAAMTVSLVGCGSASNQSSGAAAEVETTKAEETAETAPEVSSASQISVKGITALKTPVHKVVALVLEYPGSSTSIRCLQDYRYRSTTLFESK